MDIRGILLCGGASTRFGAEKLLEVLPAPSNERPGETLPMAAITARAYVSALERVLAVVRPGSPALGELLESQGCEVRVTDRALQGLGASLAAGVEAAADADGWIVGLGDMPFVAPQAIRAVRQALEEGAAIAAPFDPAGRRGHPVGFSKAFRDELLALAGDEGARRMLERNKERITRIPVEDFRAFTDIDTRDDLMRARARLSFSELRQEEP